MSNSTLQFLLVSLFKTSMMRLCLLLFFSVVVCTPPIGSLNQTLKALISRKFCLEKGSIRYFKKQQWILKLLVRYSVSKTFVVFVLQSRHHKRKHPKIVSVTCQSADFFYPLKTPHSSTAIGLPVSQSVAYTKRSDSIRSSILPDM